MNISEKADAAINQISKLASQNNNLPITRQAAKRIAAFAVQATIGELLNLDETIVNDLIDNRIINNIGEYLDNSYHKSIRNRVDNLRELHQAIKED